MLVQKHRDELHASGLTDSTIDAAGIYSTSNRAIAELLRWQPKHHDWGQGFVIPYPNRNGDALFSRVKLDFPRHNRDGKPVKYESPVKSTARAYIPDAVIDVLKNPSGKVLIVITEGEKKCLCINQHGWACIGLGGVWAWQESRPKTEGGRRYGRRVLIGDLRAIDWTGVMVVIAFDSDAVRNPLVLTAEYRLAEILIEQGATVRVARIPQDGDAKVGADDYLVKCGAEAFGKVIDAAEESSKPPAPTLTELAKSYLADRFTTKEGHTLLSWRGEFYRWQKSHYKKLTSVDELRADVLLWLDECRFKATPTTAKEVVKCIEADVMLRGDVEQPVKLDDKTHPLWLPMSNGLLDIQKAIEGKPEALRKHTLHYFSLFGLPYKYDPAATCTVWFDTLNGIFDGDTERVDLLGEWFGLCLTDDTKYHSILLCEGPPRSGKGTVLRALRHVVGKDNCCSPRLTSLGELFGLMGFLGKRVAIAPDAHLGRGDKAMAALETLKLISGEDAIEVHRKNLPPITTRLSVRFVLACNEMPKFGDGANALASRVIILPFRNSFLGHEDRELEGKIEAEAPGILRWGLEGLARLRARGRFTRPAISAEVESEFARLVNPLRVFLDDHCVIASDATVDRNALWLAWGKWCDDTGHVKGSRELLGSRLRVLIPNLCQSQRRADGGRHRVYVGLGLCPELAQ